MRKQLPLGLVLEGSSSRSAILRLPHLADELGPIKSSAMRLARRFSNLVQGGYAVAGYEELQDAALILIRVPDTAVHRVIEELCSSELVLTRLSFVLCDTWLGTEVLEPLRARGASIATVARLPAMERNWFVIEGQLRASRLTRRVIENHEGRAFEIKTGSKHLLFAAEMLIYVLPIPLLAIAQHALRTGGITGNDVAALLDGLAARTTREVTQGLRLPLPELPADCSDDLAEEFMTTLQRTRPGLAAFIHEQRNASAKLISEAWKNAIDGG